MGIWMDSWMDVVLQIFEGCRCWDRVEDSSTMDLCKPLSNQLNKNCAADLMLIQKSFLTEGLSQVLLDHSGHCQSLLASMWLLSLTASRRKLSERKVGSSFHHP